MNRRFIIIFILAFSLLLPSCGTPEKPVLSESKHKPAATTPILSKDGEYKLTGFIGKSIPITVVLVKNGNSLTGELTDESKKQCYRIDGGIGSFSQVVESNQRISLDEKDQQGKVIGTFEGAVLSPNRVVGIWSEGDYPDPDPAKNENVPHLPFSLQPIDVPIQKLSIPKLETTQKWAGRWYRQTHSMDYGELNVAFVSADILWFWLDVNAGAHMGFTAGPALINNNKAMYRDEGGSQLSFQLKGQDLVVTSNEAMDNQAGVGVTFAGLFARTPAKDPTLSELGVLQNSLQEEAFRDLVGDDYNSFRDCFNLCHLEDDLDGFGASVHAGHVRGSAPGYNAIVMVTPDNRIWAAVINDDRSDNILYFTNTKDVCKLPKTIVEWCSNSQFRKVEYMSDKKHGSGTN
ncbi:MAG: hypothetical protein ACM3UZ_06115 [Acidobacteriota bacterium]